MPNMDIDVDVEVYDVFQESSEREREELRDLVCEYYDIPIPGVDISPAAALLNALGDRAEGAAAQAFVRQMVEELEYRLKIRDFSQPIVK
jgi:hypothetical protein